MEKQFYLMFSGFVSYYVEDGDYWKIDNATLGYNPQLIEPTKTPLKICVFMLQL